MRLAFTLALVAVSCLPARAAEPHWQRIDSSHFSVLTDADEASGREIAVRFEQMRDIFAQLLLRSRVNVSEPIDIIALKTDEEFSKVCPTRPEEGIARGGFVVPGADRVYFVLNLSKNESWHAISYDFARFLLNFNYPPTQKWFDEGFAEYFSSLHLDNTKAQIGGDPQATFPGPGLPQLSAGTPTASFVELLNRTWQTIPELFTASQDASHAPGAAQRALSDAQAWIVMHYLINNNKLPETGTYFALVQIEKIPVEEAIQKAYGMSSVQLGQAVKDYFRSLTSPSQKQSAGRADAGTSNPFSQPLSPASGDVIGTSTREVLAFYARALLAEMSLRLPEHRDAARKELLSLVGESRTETAIAHRALGWDDMEKKEFDPAREEFNKAMELDPKDPWPYYYLALTKYQEFHGGGHQVRGLANMMPELHTVLEWKPEFAEAYHMLGWAQREGGGVHAALDSIRAAIQLNPRDQSYLLEMARVYLAGKNWDAATAVLERLAGGSDVQLASAARGYLQDLPMLRKYGVAAQSGAASQPEAKPATATASTPTPASPQPGTKTPTAQPPAEAADESSDEPAEPQIDKRPIQYLKAKLIAMDCSHPPAAVLTISSGTKTLKLLAPDYKSLTLVGEDQFSCDWRDRAVSVNYKAGGKADGDLVSLEMR